jgi:hypothetical protein
VKAVMMRCSCKEKKRNGTARVGESFQNGSTIINRKKITNVSQPEMQKIECPNTGYYRKPHHPASLTVDLCEPCPHGVGNKNPLRIF